MAKTQYYCAATLDGYIADPDDGIDWLTGYEGTYDGEVAAPSPMGEGGGYERFYDEIGALVSGSATYEWVLDHYSDPWPYLGKPWWVLSSREQAIPAGDGIDVRVAEGEIAGLHEQMLATADGRNLWVLGGGNIASQLAEAGLLDEVLLTVVPVVLGEGKPLFERPLPGPMQLTSSSAFGNGMVELRYRLGRSDGS